MCYLYHWKPFYYLKAFSSRLAVHMVHRNITAILFCQSTTPTAIQTNSTTQLFLYPAVTTVIGSVEIKHTWQKPHTKTKSNQPKDIWNNKLMQLIWRLVKLCVLLLILFNVSAAVLGLKWSVAAQGECIWICWRWKVCAGLYPYQ